MNSFFQRSRLPPLSLFLATLFIAVSVSAMSSASYRIDFDSVNSGGLLATSTSYQMQDTAGDTATGLGTSTSYRLNAGYEQNSPTTISISAPTNITMDALTITQNSAVATTTWTVITNDAAGYTLSVNASQAPAMKNLATGATFADQGATTTVWSVSNAYAFGFSATGANTTGFGTGSQCAPTTANVPSTTLWWRGFSGATTIQVASSSAATAQAGTATTVCLADAQNTVFAPSGTYVATTTATAVAL